MRRHERATTAGVAAASAVVARALGRPCRAPSSGRVHTLPRYRVPPPPAGCVRPEQVAKMLLEEVSRPNSNSRACPLPRVARSGNPRNRRARAPLPRAARPSACPRLQPRLSHCTGLSPYLDPPARPAPPALSLTAHPWRARATQRATPKPPRARPFAPCPAPFEPCYPAAPPEPLLRPQPPISTPRPPLHPPALSLIAQTWRACATQRATPKPPRARPFAPCSPPFGMPSSAAPPEPLPRPQPPILTPSPRHPPALSLLVLPARAPPWPATRNR